MTDRFLPFSAKLTTGEDYTGVQQFVGNGTMRSCMICGKHRPNDTGYMRKMFGALHWVCKEHKKEAAK